MPATDRYGQGVQYLQLSDAPNFEQLGDWLANGILPHGVLRFDSATARAAVLTGDSAATAGMAVWLRAEKRLEIYDGAAWRVVQTNPAPAWQSPALASGYGQDGDGNGTLQYRLLDLAGVAHVQWRGGVSVTYSGSVIPNGGQPISVSVPAAYRPSSRRTLAAACSGAASSKLSVKIDFNTNGTVPIVGTEAGVTPPWISFNGLMYPL